MVDALSERVEVEAVVERSEDNLVVVTIRLPDGIAEQARLATEEWVHEQLRARSDGVVLVPRYV